MASGFSLDFYFFCEVLPQYKIEKLTSPNLTFPFDYNLLILPVDEEFKVHSTKPLRVCLSKNHTHC